MRHSVSPLQRTTANSILRVGSTIIPNLITMANNTGNCSFTSLRLLSSSAEDGKARVKRVSIEGNIGEYSILK